MKDITITGTPKEIAEAVKKICKSLKGAKITALIPKGVEVIEDGAFSDCSWLTAVVLPDTLKIISRWAFARCSGLTTIRIPKSVTAIGGGAFRGCSGLTAVVWNATNCTSAGSFIFPAFEGCYNLKTVMFADNVETIPDAAFSCCIGLTSVTIPNSVKSIGELAFAYSSLHMITIGNGVESIGYDAFQGCELNCKTYENGLYIGNGRNPYIVLIKAKDKSCASFKIHPNTKVIYNYAFYGCSGLTSVTIPDSVTSIGGSAFYGCSGLTEITIPDSVTSIGGSAFYGCSGLTSITIPNSITSIEESAFADSGLTSRLGNYKAFILTPDGKMKCRDKIYTVGKRSFAKGPLVLCENGLHYCTNLFDIFNYYYGEYGRDFVIAECKVSKKNIGKEDGDSKRCARSIVPERILSREEVIGILNS